MKSYGINHFCPNGRQPVLWAIILLLCGDYTTAIAYLHSTSFQTDAVHLAIALTHYQKLNISHTGDELFRTKNSTGDSVVVDISMLIYSYASKFSVSNSHEAIQYILILGNIKDSDPSISYSAIACNYLVNIICENIDKIDNLVGAQGSDGTTRSTGYIEQHGKLVDITSSSQFVSNILSPAAEKCDSEGRVLDAVLLFDRAGEYSHVFLLLSRKLGELVSMFHIPCPLTPQIGKKEALIITAKEYYQKYTIKCPSILRKIQNSTVKAVSTLLTMYDFLDLVCRGSYSESLNLIDTIDIFPSNQRNLSDLDSSVASCIPLILVTLMDVLYVLFVETKKMVNRDGSARARMDEIKKRSGDLVLFCAGSRFKLTGDVYGRVVGVDADMV